MEKQLNEVLDKLMKLVPQECCDGALRLVSNPSRTPELSKDLLDFLTSMVNHLQSQELKIKQLQNQPSRPPPASVETHPLDGKVYYSGGPSIPAGPTYSQGPHGKSPGTYSVVKVFTLVTGQTCRVHDVILKQITSDPSLNVNVVPNPQDCDLIVIFCPIVSRVGSDVEAALKKIPESLGEKPVILVLMHHTRKENHPIEETDWSLLYPNVVTDVHILFHETKNGLLGCGRNNEAIQKLCGLCYRFGKRYNKVLPPEPPKNPEKSSRSWKVW